MVKKDKKSISDFVDTKVIVVVFVAVVFALAAGYAWQVGSKKSQVFRLKKENTILRQQVADLQNENTEFKSAFADLKTDEKRSVHVVFPNGSESLCLNEEAIIRWESKEVKAIRIRLVEYRGEGRAYYYLAHSALAESDDSGEPGKGLFLWKVGEYLLKSSRQMGDIKEGYNYKIEISSVDGRVLASDLSNDVFTILLCEG